MTVNPWSTHPWEDEVAEWDVPFSPSIILDFRTEGYNWGPIHLTDNMTLANPLTMLATVGKSGYIRFIEDQAGDRVVNFGDAWDAIGVNYVSLTPYATTILYYSVVTPTLVQYWTTFPLGPYNRIYQVQPSIYPPLDASQYEKNVELVAPPAVIEAISRAWLVISTGNAHPVHAIGIATVGTALPVSSGELISVSDGTDTTLYVNPPSIAFATATPLTAPLQQDASTAMATVTAALGALTTITVYYNPGAIAYAVPAGVAVSPGLAFQIDTFENDAFQISTMLTTQVSPYFTGVAALGVAGSVGISSPLASTVVVVNVMAAASDLSLQDIVQLVPVPAIGYSTAAGLRAGPGANVTGVAATVALGTLQRTEADTLSIAAVAATNIGAQTQVSTGTLTECNVVATVNTSVSFSIAGTQASCLATVGGLQVPVAFEADAFQNNTFQQVPVLNVSILNTSGVVAAFPVGASPVA